MTQSATVDGAATAQSAAVLEGAARIQQAAAAVKIANTELVSVPKQLTDIVAQAGYQSSTGTIAFAGQYASGGYAVQYNSPTGGWGRPRAGARMLRDAPSRADQRPTITP